MYEGRQSVAVRTVGSGLAGIPSHSGCPHVPYSKGCYFRHIKRELHLPVLNRLSIRHNLIEHRVYRTEFCEWTRYLKYGYSNGDIDPTEANLAIYFGANAIHGSAAVPHPVRR